MVKKYEIQRVWGEDVLNEIDLLVFILIFFPTLAEGKKIVGSK